MVIQMNQKFAIIRARKQKFIAKKYKLNQIFVYNDMFCSILEFVDETDKMRFCCVNSKLSKIMKTSRICPIIYKFNSAFFTNNITNQKVINIYVANYHIFSKLLTFEFLLQFCSCDEKMCHTHYGCICLNRDCMSCYIYETYRSNRICWAITGSRGATGATDINCWWKYENKYQKIKNNYSISQSTKNKNNKYVGYKQNHR